MVINIEKLTGTKNVKKNNKILNYLNENHINELHDLSINKNILSLEGLGLKFLSEKKTWDTKYLLRIFSTIGILKETTEELIKEGKAFSISKINIGYKNVFRSNCNIFKNIKAKANNILSDKNNLIYVDFVNYLEYEIMEVIKQGKGINIFNYFIIFNGNKRKYKIISTLTGLRFLNEK